MSALGDIASIITEINQRGDADDIANQAVAGQLPDVNGVPGSGIVAAWAQKHGTTPLPAGLDALAGQARQKAFGDIGGSLARGEIDTPTALAKLVQIAPTPEMLQNVMNARMNAQLFGGGQNPPQTGQSAPQPQQSALGRVAQFAPGSNGDTNPTAPIPQALPPVSGQPPQGAPASLGPVQPPSFGDNLRKMAAQGALTQSPEGVMNLGLGLEQKQATIDKDKADAASANASAAEKRATTVTAPSGGPISEAQKEEDKEFGKTWDTFSKTGGSDQIRVAMDTINQVQNDLKTGAISTGGNIDAVSTDSEGHPNIWGSLLNRKLMADKTRVDSTIAPLLKPLFGARVTNFEASSLMKSLGIDPLASTQQNIAKLDQLKDKLGSAARDFGASGDYFQKHQTLAEYGGNPSITQPNQPAPQAAVPQSAQPSDAYTQALLAEAKKRKLMPGGQ